MPGVLPTQNWQPRLELGQALKEYIFSPGLFLGLELMPLTPVPRRTGIYPVLGKGGILRRDGANNGLRREVRSNYLRTGSKVGQASYSCEERGVEHQLDFSEISFYRSYFDAEMHSVEQAMWAVLLEHELSVQGLVIDTTNFTTGNGRRTDVATAWSNVAAPIVSNVISAMESIRARTGLSRANPFVEFVWWIPAIDLPNVLKNTDILDGVRYIAEPGVDAILSSLVARTGVDRVVIGNGVYNSAEETTDDDSATVTDIWGTGWSGIVGVPRGAANGLVNPGFGRTLVWSDETPDGVLAESYEEPQTRSIVHRARLFSDEHVANRDFAQLLDTAA